MSKLPKDEPGYILTANVSLEYEKSEDQTGMILGPVLADLMDWAGRLWILLNFKSDYPSFPVRSFIGPSISLVYNQSVVWFQCLSNFIGARSSKHLGKPGKVWELQSHVKANNLSEISGGFEFKEGNSPGTERLLGRLRRQVNAGFFYSSAEQREKLVELGS